MSHPDPSREYHEDKQLERQHVLKITSLGDVIADCSCGWHYALTGSLTRQQVREKHSDFDEYGNFKKRLQPTNEEGK